MTVELEWWDSQTGRSVAAVDRFPYRVGRSGADLEVRAPGVWDRHFELARGEAHAFVVSPGPEASLVVNGSPLTGVAVLRNGDRIGCGAVEFLFRLAPTQPKSLKWREGATWLFLSAWLMLQGVLALAWPR